MKHEEKDIELRCCAYARKHGLAAVKLEKNGNTGIPDRVFIKRGGACLFVEFKTATGKPTALQKLFADFLGASHCYVNSFEAFTNTIADFIK